MDNQETVEVESVEWRIYDADRERVASMELREAQARRWFGEIREREPETRFELHSRKVSAWEVVS